MYTLRPYHKLDMCLYAYGQENSVRIRQNIKDGSTDSADPNYVIAAYRWSIEYVSGGYVIKHNGESDETLHIENGSTALNAQARVQTYSNSNNCRWTFSLVNNPASGVILYDTEEQQQIIYNENDEPKILYIAPEEVRSLKELGVCAAMYSPTKIDQTFTLSKSSSYIELTPEVKVKGVKYSGENSATLVMTAGALTSGNTISLNVKVTAIPNSTYYIQNKETEQYIDIGNSADEGDSVKMDAFEYADYQKWTFTHTGDGYYTIYNTKQSSFYMRVDEDSTEEGASVVVSTNSSAVGALWKIKKLSNGSFTLSPKNGANVNRVAAVNERLIVADTVELEDYVNDDTYTDEWELYNVVISMVNYYDSSFDAELVANIEDANNFVTNLYKEQFEISIKMDGAATQYESLADSCSAEGHCTGNCESDGKHCQDVFALAEDLLNNTNENNHIYILWANRPLGTYCKYSPTNSGEYATFDAYACVPFTEPNNNLENYRREYKPAVFIATLPNGTIDEQKMAMCIFLAHEIAHTLSMPEVYIDDNDHTARHGDYDCIMDEYENDDYDLSDFYTNILPYVLNNGAGNNLPFCEDCETELDSWLTSNEPIKRYQGE